jgi:hypothetical protein
LPCLFPLFTAQSLRIFLHPIWPEPSRNSPSSGQYTTAEGEAVIPTF